jgi:MATE family multidrug resistance protein
MSLISYIKSHSKSEFIDESKHILELTAPAFVAQFCRIAVYIVNGLFLGRLEDDAMAAAALGGSWHSSALYFGIGVSFAMDTLVSQAYGARNYRFIGVVFQNALVVAVLIYLPIALAFWFTEPVLVLLKQDPRLANLAGQYNRWLIPGVLPLLIYRAQTQYLQNQRILKPAMVSGAISVVLSIPLNYLLIFGFPELKIFGLAGASLHAGHLKPLGGWKGLGFIGAPIAGSLTWLAQPIILWAYVSWTGVHRQSWFGCDWRQALDVRNLATFLKLGIPASLMLAMEVIGFEIATIFVGTFHDVTAIKAHAIGFNITTVVFIIPIGLAIGATTRVGNRLGEGQSSAAKFSALVGASMIASLLVFIGTLLIAFRGIIPRAYSSSEHVIEFCKKLMPLIAALAFFDGLQTFNGALMRSVGRPLAGSIVNFLGYYLLAIPIAAGLAWGAKWKIFGVWCGLVAGLCGASIGYCVLIYRVNWEEEAKLARERVHASDVSLLDDGVDSPPQAENAHLGDDLAIELDDSSMDEVETELQLESSSEV